MIDYYNKCSTSPECVPNLEGTWNLTSVVLRRNSINEQPDFDNIKMDSFKGEVTQHGPFIFYKQDTVTRMGVLSFAKNVWTLKMVDGEDNGMITLLPKNDKDYTYWVGDYVEAGFSPTNPLQLQTVATVEFKKIAMHHCCCQK